jgi:hypothetical protein
MTATIIHCLPVDGEACPKRHIEGSSEPVDVDAFDAALEMPAEAASPLLTNRHQDYRMTRRSIFIGAAAALICAPGIVRATGLMPVPSLPLQSLNPLGEFYRRCFYHSLESDLRAGRSMSTIVDGKIVSVAEARRMVAHARAQGWLSAQDRASAMSPQIPGAPDRAR